MKSVCPVLIHGFSKAEHAAVIKARRSSSGVTSRRASVITLSEAGYTVPKIAQAVGLRAGWVRKFLHAANQEGVAPMLHPTGRRTGRRRRFGEQVALGLERISPAAVWQRLLGRTGRAHMDTCLWLHLGRSAISEP